MENKSENAAKNAVKPSSKGKKKKIIIAIIAVAVIATTIFMLTGGNYESTDNAQLDADIVPVRSSVSGYVKAILFEDNQPVKKGQLLLVIDETELKTKVAQAAAALENVQANLNAVKSNAQATSENADAAGFSTATSQESIATYQARLTKVKADFKRIKNMFSAKAATQAEFDAVSAELDVAQSQYDAAILQNKASQAQTQGVRSQAQGQRAMVSLAEALVRQREAELTLATTQLGYAAVKAPCDGIVSKRAVEVGQFISVGQPLCSTIDNTSLWVTANFKETQLKNMHVGQTVKVKIDAYPDMKLTGTFDSYIGATGAKFSLLPPDNATGNFVKIVQRVPVKISLNNISKKELAKLFPGLSAYVSVKVK